MASNGFDVERWRAWHRARGESYRWLKAFRISDPRSFGQADRNGRIYVEQTVDPAWKALVYQSEVDYEDKDFGVISKGTSVISVMPDETFLARLDRIILPERQAVSRALLTRGGTATDALVFTPVASIESVRKDLTVYQPGSDYKLTGDTVEWLGGGNAPGEGQSYTVEYFYNPTYEFIGYDFSPRPGYNNLLMPQRGALLLYRPNE